MCNPIAIGAVMAAAAATTSFMDSESQRVSQQYQANMMGYEATIAEQNAQAMRNQAALELQKGQAAQMGLDIERNRMRQAYEKEAGANRSLMASGNVDISSGSAADSLLGNVGMFGEDLWVNRYNHAITGWEGREAARAANAQAIGYNNQAAGLRSQASWLKKSAGGVGKSLLTAGIAGGMGFLSGYSMAGGSFFGGGTKPFFIEQDFKTALNGVDPFSTAWKP